MKEALKLRVPHLSVIAVTMTVVSFSVGFLMGYDQVIASTEYVGLDGVEAKDVGPKRIIPSSTMELLGVVSKERKLVQKKLTLDYAHYFGIVFDKMHMSKMFVMSDQSRDRLLRRIMMKIISAQIDPQADTKFTWTTAGDASAAGHGNLISQSYTEVMEQTVRESFAAVGVNFISENSAIGGYGSAPELAMCMEAVYGSDLDVLSWDFSFMDRERYYRSALWGNRAAVHPTKPILFMSESRFSPHWEHFVRLEGKGMGTVLMDSIELDTLKRRLPDANDPSKNHEGLPHALRSFICNGATEGFAPCDDPNRNYMCGVEGGEACVENKFVTGITCDFGVSGWKDHLLKGRLLGFFLLEMLQEALMSLDELKHRRRKSSKLERGDWRNILAHLEQKEKLDRFLFHKSPVLLENWMEQMETVNEIGPTVLHKNPATCHTFVSPRSRHEAVLNESQHEGEDGRDAWIAQRSIPSSDESPPLSQAVFEPNDPMRCYMMGDPDRHRENGFQVRDRDGWMSKTLPNSGELKVRGMTEYKEGNLIMVCLRRCTESGCLPFPDGVEGSEFAHGDVEMEVDGVPVVGSKAIEDCHFIEGMGGVSWGEPEGKTGYTLSFRVSETVGLVRISSLCVITT